MLPAEPPRSQVVVGVVVVAPPFLAAAARRLLVVGELERALGAERAVVEPVVAYPAIHHRRKRDRGLECRVRIARSTSAP